MEIPSPQAIPLNLPLWGRGTALAVDEVISIHRPRRTHNSAFKKRGRSTRSSLAISYSLFFSSRPSSQSADTCKIVASAFSSISETGRFCPSNSESAGVLKSTPESCNFASNSFCFIPSFFRASVTRAPTMLRSPNANFLVFTIPPPFLFIIWEYGVDKFGITKYNKFNLEIPNLGGYNYVHLLLHRPSGCPQFCAGSVR